MMVKQWMGKADFAPGLKTWTIRHAFLFLQGNQYQYTLSQSATGWCEGFTSIATTATVSSGTAVNVSSTTNIATGVNFGLVLDNGNIFWTTVLSIVGNVVNLNAAVPSQSTVGATVFTYTTAQQATQPLFIKTAVLRDSTSNDIPLRLMTLEDYAYLPSKTSITNISDPMAIYPEFQLGYTNLFIDCGGAQDVTKYIVIDYLEPIQDMVNPNDSFEYPQEWFLPITFGLSKLISPMFRAVWTPELETTLTGSLAIAKQKDAEINHLYFQPGEDGNG